MISIQNITVHVNQQCVLKNVSLNLEKGTVTALMGPNGSGKSSLANVLAGNPEYQCASGSIMLDGEDLLALPIHERALKGLFVLFQQIPAIPGLSVFTFLKEALFVRKKEHLDVMVLEQKIIEYMNFLGLDRSFLYRSVHDGFSGGEKKRFELLQLLVLKPHYVILDEIDSGLDIDALKLVKEVIDMLRNENPFFAVLCITHYQRMIHQLKPSHVHVLYRGMIVESGGYSLVDRIDVQGYQHYGQ